MFVKLIQQLPIRTFLIRLIVLILACQLPLYASGKSTGTTAMNFLHLGHSVKSVALGNALVAEGGLAALTLNPASLYHIDGRAAQFQYLRYVQDITYANISGAYRLPIGTVGLNMGLIDFGSSLRTTLSDQSGSSGETFSNSGYQVQAAYANQLWSLDMGVSLQYASMTLDSRTADSVGLDMGLQKQLNTQWRVGASVTNITLKKQKFIVQESDLPQTMRIGATYTTVLRYNPLVIYGELGRPNDDDTYYAFGADLLLNDRLHLRAGYTTFGDVLDTSVGMGLDISPFTIDFTYRPTRDFGETYRFGIGIALED